MSSQQANGKHPEKTFYEFIKDVKIDGYEMIQDIEYLCGLKARQIPLEINRNWHPDVLNIYKKIASGEAELPEKGETSNIPDGTQYFIYETDPIDDWQGYHKLHLNDIFYDPKWRHLVYHSVNILKINSAWEGDIREGPYVLMLPGEEWDFAHWVVLLKQDNNGTTFVVSNYRLDHLEEFFVKCVTIKIARSKK